MPQSPSRKVNQADALLWAVEENRDKLACGAALWYTLSRRTFDRGVAGNYPRSEYNLFWRSYHEYSIPILHQLQISSCFPLDRRRKVIMGVPKDPDKYAEYIRKQSESHKGQKVSEEGKRQRSLDMIERRKDPAYMEKLMNGIANREMTEEYHRNLSEAAKKRGVSQAFIDAAKESNKGRVQPEEERRRRSEATKGRRLGPGLSPEARLRASERVKANPPRKGYKMTPEEYQSHIERIRANADKIGAKVKANWDSLTEEEKSDRIIRSLAATSHKPSSLEVRVSEYLMALGIAHKTQFRIGRYITDIYIPELHLVLEIMGCYWHGCEECGYSNPEKQAQDKKRYEVITGKGYPMVFIWEHSIKADLGQAILQAMEGYT